MKPRQMYCSTIMYKQMVITVHALSKNSVSLPPKIRPWRKTRAHAGRCISARDGHVVSQHVRKHVRCQIYRDHNSIIPACFQSRCRLCMRMASVPKCSKTTKCHALQAPQSPKQMAGSSPPPRPLLPAYRNISISQSPAAPCCCCRAAAQQPLPHTRHRPID